jgi:hypothetical protein
MSANPKLLTGDDPTPEPKASDQPADDPTREPQAPPTGGEPKDAGDSPAPADGDEPTDDKPAGDGEPQGDDEPEGDEPDGEDEPDGPPEQYELTVPDGYELPEQELEGFTEVARELGLSNAQAQRLVDFEVARQKADLERWQQESASAEKELREHPEFGGKRFKENLQLARTGYRIFADLVGEEAPAIKAALEASGVGDNPVVIRAFAKLGEAFAEPNTPADSKRASGRSRDSLEDRLESMYPNTP